MPHNIEILFDSETYFMEYESFPEVGEEMDELSSIVKQIVDDLWKEFDMDGSGDLDKEETRNMLKDICKKNKKKYINKSTTSQYEDKKN